VSDGRVVLGLIDPGTGGSDPIADLTLRFTLKPGQKPGGEVSLETAAVTAHDGATIVAAAAPAAQPLGGPPRLSLSASRPNPFGSEARFSVTLDRPGALEVGIYDLGGRRLMSLYHGDLAAGTHDFTWDGQIEGGSRARDGVYFYRAATRDGAETRKLVLLRSP